MKKMEPSGIVRIERPGPPEVLTYHTTSLQQPANGEVFINQQAIGVNFADVFFRNGTFPIDAYPAPIGFEAAGIIEHVGAGVDNFTVGDRVAYHSSLGSYAEGRVLSAKDLFKLPDDVSFDQAAALMIKGLTAHMLLKESHEVKTGDVVLIHAVAGGVGTVLSKWARSIGATVIGTVGSAAKKELVLQRGFDHVVNLQLEDFTDKVLAVTQGKGIDVVYDGVGEATFQRSLALVKNGGSAVLYGWPSGMPAVDTEVLELKKIRFIRAVLNNYLADRDRINGAMLEIFDLLRKGIIDAENPLAYALRDASKAHADLESRKTTGSIILRP